MISKPRRTHIRACRPRKHNNYCDVYAANSEKIDKLTKGDYFLYNDIVNEYYELLKKELSEGKDVHIKGIGKIGIRKHKFHYINKKVGKLIGKERYFPLLTDDYIAKFSWERLHYNITKSFKIVRQKTFMKDIYRNHFYDGKHKKFIEYAGYPKNNRKYNRQDCKRS